MLNCGACFTDQPVSEDGEEAKQEGGADAGQQRLKAGHQTTQGTLSRSSLLHSAAAQTLSE